MHICLNIDIYVQIYITQISVCSSARSQARDGGRGGECARGRCQLRCVGRGNAPRPDENANLMLMQEVRSFRDMDGGEATGMLANLIPQPETRNTKLETRNPKSEIRNPKPETRNPKPEARNPKPETRISKPKSRILKPETRNPKPETRNPSPETLNSQF